jgi:hypothetical protein
VRWRRVVDGRLVSSSFLLNYRLVNVRRGSTTHRHHVVGIRLAQKLPHIAPPRLERRPALVGILVARIYAGNSAFGAALGEEARVVEQVRAAIGKATGR